MTILGLALTYIAVGCIWHYRNTLRDPLFQIGAPPLVSVLLWPIALCIRLAKFWSPRRYQVGFAAYDPENPVRAEIPTYKFFSSWAEAIAYAKDLAHTSGRKVTIHDEARYAKGLSGYGPRWQTISPSEEVTGKSSSHIYTNESPPLQPVPTSTYEKGIQALEEGDYVTAMKAFRSSANDGNLSAMHWLGAMHLDGKGVSVNHREAAQWFLRAAESGHHDSQFCLGCMYQAGTGVAQNLHETIRWWRKAAEQGNSMAQYNLGLMYAQGEGVREDPLEARQWVEKAAEQGETRAFYNLGNLYRAEPKDYIQACKWLNLSIMNNEDVEKAIEMRSALETRMTHAQIAEAERQAREWVPKYLQT